MVASMSLLWGPCRGPGVWPLSAVQVHPFSCDHANTQEAGLGPGLEFRDALCLGQGATKQPRVKARQL